MKISNPDALEDDFQLDIEPVDSRKHAREPEADELSSAAQKRKEKRKAKRRKRITEDERFVPVNDAEALSSYLWARLLKDYPKISDVELHDLRQRQINATDISVRESQAESPEPWSAIIKLGKSILI